MTLWPSGLRRQLQVLDTLSALFRKGVGSSPTGVIVLHFQLPESQVPTADL